MFGVVVIWEENGVHRPRGWSGRGREACAPAAGGRESGQTRRGGSAVRRPSSGRSPWAPPHHRAVVIHPPTGPIDGRVTVPGSKSLTNRALLLAAVAEGDRKSVAEGK